MAVLTWDQDSERLYEAGVDHGIFFPYSNGSYGTGIAWNGLTKVTEKASGGDATSIYADNIKYLSLRAVEEFEATIEAYAYPEEFLKCDGFAVGLSGVYLGQQKRQMFGLSYRTRLGNDTEYDDYGYKLHLVYGLTVSPAERAYETIDDSPDAVSFSWDAVSQPIVLSGNSIRPVSSITIDSTKVSSSVLETITNALEGTSSTNSYLPLPSAILLMT